VLFAENLYENILLEHPHRHVIFSLPKRLRVYFRFDRKLFSHLYRAAWESWNEYVQEHFPGASTGAVMSLHTAGDLLHWHPHVHAIALDGALIGNDFVQLPSVDDVELQRRFSTKVFQFLLERELISQDIVDGICAQEHTGFNVYAAEAISEEDEDARLFLSRYLKKPPVAADRLSIDESGLEPRVCYTKKLDDAESEVREFSALEFLANLSSHIPLVFEQTTRFFGRCKRFLSGVLFSQH